MAHEIDILHYGDQFEMRIDPPAGEAWTDDLTLNESVFNLINLAGHNPSWRPFRRKYPLVRDGKAIVIGELDTHIRSRELPNIQIPSGLINDGAISSEAINQAVTSKSQWADHTDETNYENDLITDASPLFYLDLENGDDATAAPHTRTDAEVGDWRNPVGAVNAYKTPLAWFDAMRGTSSQSSGRDIHAVGLIIGGTVLNQSTHNIQAIIDCSQTGGIGNTQQFCFEVYGAGDVYFEISVDNPKQGIRFLNKGWVHFGPRIKIRGTDGKGTGIYNQISSSRQYEGICFQGMEIHDVSTGVQLGEAETVNPASDVRGFTFADGVIRDTGADAVNGNPSSANHTREGVRVIRTLRRRHGSTPTKHAYYGSNNEDVSFAHGYIDEAGGAGYKANEVASIDGHTEIITRCDVGILQDTNGEEEHGLRIDRTIDSPGSSGKRSYWNDIVMSHIQSSVIRMVAAERVGFGRIYGHVDGVGGTGLNIRNDSVNGVAGNIYTKDAWFVDYGAITVVADTPIQFAVPEQDDPTVENAIGWHSVVLDRVIAMRAPGSDPTRPIFEFRNAPYALNKAAGRCDLVFTNSVLWAEDGVFLDGSTTHQYNEFANLQAAADNDLDGLTLVDPGVSVWTVADYIRNVLGFVGDDDTVLDAFYDELEDQILAFNVPANRTAKAIKDACFTAIQPANLNAASFGGTLPGPPAGGEAPTAPQLRVTDSGASVVASGSTIDLGDDLEIDSVNSVTLTIHNDGDADLDIATATATGSMIVVSADDPTGSTVAPAGTDTVSVVLNTSTSGSKTGTLSIASNDGSSPFVVNFTATVAAQLPELLVTDAVAQAVASGSTISLGNDLAIGSTNSVQLTLSNIGDAQMSINATAADGHAMIDASDDPEESTVEAGQDTTITIDLSTDAPGARTGTITINTNDADTPFIVTLNATVVAEPAELSVFDSDDNPITDGADAFEMGDALVVGDESHIQFTLTNTGDEDLEIIALIPTNDITVLGSDDPNGQILSAGQSVTVTLVLDTATAGVKFGSIIIQTDDSDDDFFVASFTGEVHISDPNIGDGPGPDTIQSYLSVAETDVLVALSLLSTDIEREAYESIAAAADRAVCVVNASDDIDAVLWDGKRLDESQASQFPRRNNLGQLILPGGEADVPNTLGQAAWSVPSIPREIRIAVAIQSAYRAAMSLGVVPMPSETSNPLSRLHPNAKAVARRYLRRSASFA